VGTRNECYGILEDNQIKELEQGSGIDVPLLDHEGSQFHSNRIHLTLGNIVSPLELGDGSMTNPGTDLTPYDVKSIGMGRTIKRYAKYRSEGSQAVRMDVIFMSRAAWDEMDKGKA